MKKSFERFYPLIVFLFACSLYVNTIPNDYNLDDELVTINHRTTSKGFSAISEIIHSYYYEDEMGYKYGYRPVTHISFAIEHQFFGENPHTSHVINVLLYALLCLAIYFLTQKLAPDKGPFLGLLVAMIFAVHPLHTEVVASIKNRDEILSLLFGVLAFIFMIQSEKKASIAPKLLLLVLALTSFYASFLSKMSTVGLIVLIPLFAILRGKVEKQYYIFILVGSVGFSSIIFSKNLERIVVTTTLMLALLFFDLKLQGFFQRLYQNYIRKQVKLENVKWGLIVLAYIFALLAWFFGVGLLFIFSIAAVIAGIYLSTRYKENVLWMFVLTCPVVLIISYFYNIIIINTWFFFIFAIVVRQFKLEDLKVPLLIMLAGNALLAVFSDIGIGVVFGLLPLLTLIDKKRFNYWVILWAFLNILLNSEEVFLIAINGLTFVIVLVNYLPFLLEKLNTKNLWLKSLPVLFLLFAITSFYLQKNLQRYENLPESKFSRIVETDEILGLQETVEEFKDIDRPILYVENPIVENWDIKSRVALSANTTTFYLRKMIVPFPLSFYYGYGGFELPSFKSMETIFSLIFLLSIVIIIGFCLWKGYIYLCFGILFLFVNLIPYLNLILPIAGVVGERLTFTASFGFSFLLGLLAWHFFIKRPKISTAIYVVILLAASYTTIARNFDWKDKTTLYSHDIKNVPNSAQANALLGYEYMRLSATKQSLEEVNAQKTKSLKYLDRAAQIYPDFFNWHFDKGRLYFEIQEFSKSKSSFQKALNIDDAFQETYYYLLEIEKNESNWNQVLINGNKILAWNPEDINVMIRLSEALYFLEKYEEVLAINNKIIVINSSVPEAYLNKAYAFWELENLVSFKSMLKKAENLNPNHPDLLHLKKRLQ